MNNDYITEAIYNRLKDIQQMGPAPFSPAWERLAKKFIRRILDDFTAPPPEPQMEKPALTPIPPAKPLKRQGNSINQPFKKLTLK
jgi:hypothetical protein